MEGDEQLERLVQSLRGSDGHRLACLRRAPKPLGRLFVIRESRYATGLGSVTRQKRRDRLQGEPDALQRVLRSRRRVPPDRLDLFHQAADPGLEQMLPVRHEDVGGLEPAGHAPATEQLRVRTNERFLFNPWHLFTDAAEQDVVRANDRRNLPAEVLKDTALAVARRQPGVCPSSLVEYPGPFQENGFLRFA